MAILTGINTRLSGSVGDWTFSQLHGQTIAKQKVAPKAEPVRTVATQTRRVAWANIVNLWKRFEGSLHPSFENRPQGVSDFNEFLRANIGIVDAYLTKTEARAGGAVVAPYQVTRGSLPSVSVSISTGTDPSVSTDIVTGTFTPGPQTTVADFSRAIITSNADYQNGDQISYFRLDQTVGSDGIPRTKVNAYEFTINLSDTTAMSEYPTGFEVVSGHIGAESMTNGGVTWVHSRKTSSGTLVSTQHLVVSNNILDDYQSDAQLWEAIESYGGVRREQFLTPNITTTEPIVPPEE